MAIQTRTIVKFDDGKCIWTYQYDDVGLFLTNLSCDNTQGTKSTTGTATVISNGRTFNRTVAAGGTLSQAIPTGPAVRLGITVDGRGRVDGVDWSFSYGP